MPKIAIHERHGGYNKRWIQYCLDHGIDYKLVNCCSTDIIEHLGDCDGLMWNWTHDDYRDQLFARQLIFTLESMGLKVFPNYATCWHYDDKVGQKYLLESLGAPLIPSFVFYTKQEAMDWLNTVELPKVFKLRAGAGSANVVLIKSRGKGKRLISRAFSSGFASQGKWAKISQYLWYLRRDKSAKAAWELIKSMGRVLVDKPRHHLLPRQKGYVYFQDFIAGNAYDQRVLVIGDRAISHRRYVRTNDFRASGSGLVHIEKEIDDLPGVRSAFEVYKALHAQCVAFDFIYGENRTPLIVEISYASPPHVYDLTPGYWDSDLNWHDKPVNPQYFMIEDFINSIETNHQ